MKKLIFVFPGQASQYVGMGRNLYENSDAARNLMDTAVKLPGLDHIKEVAFDGPEDRLTRTDNVQPAITIVSLMTLAALRESAEKSDQKLRLLACAGHSLGEYAAHAAAGNLSFTQAIELTQKRGAWMNEASQPPNPAGGMIAIMGLPLDDVKAIAAKLGADRIALANVNSPGQFILSGNAEAIAEAYKLASAACAKRVIPLNVSGAWHSPLMNSARTKMTALLAERLPNISTPINSEVKVVANASSDVVKSPDELRDTLGKQVTSPVIWTDCVRRLLTATGYPGLPGELTPENLEKYSPWPIFVEVGPGKVLRGLIRSIDKGIETAGVEDMASIEAFLQTIG